MLEKIESRRRRGRHRMSRLDGITGLMDMSLSEDKGTTQDEMVGWHHRLDGHEFEQAPGVGDGKGALACCSPWGRKELNMTE